MSKLIIVLPIHSLKAKTVAEYLEEHGGDATAALTASQKDTVAREGQNSKARAFQRSYKRLIETLKLPADPDDADAASDAALAALKELQDSGQSAEQIKAALEKLGLDPAKLDEQIAALKTQAEAGAEGTKLKRDLAFRDAADALGFDAAKLTKILRDEKGTPELRKIKQTIDGKETEVDTWGIPGEGTAFVALAAHPDVTGFEASLKRSTETTTVPATTTPVIPAQRAGIPTGTPLPPATDRVVVNGAGTI